MATTGEARPRGSRQPASPATARRTPPPAAAALTLRRAARNALPEQVANGRQVWRARLDGALDGAAATRIQVQLHERVAAGDVLWLDLGKVDHIDPAGLRLLLSSSVLATRAGGLLHLAPVSAPVHRQIAISRLGAQLLPAQGAAPARRRRKPAAHSAVSPVSSSPPATSGRP